jgi:hypothetical protein
MEQRQAKPAVQWRMFFENGLILPLKDYRPAEVAEAARGGNKMGATGIIGAILGRDQLFIRDRIWPRDEAGRHFAGHWAAIHIADDRHILTAAQHKFDGTISFAL